MGIIWLIFGTFLSFFQNISVTRPAMFVDKKYSFLRMLHYKFGGSIDTQITDRQNVDNRAAHVFILHLTPPDSPLLGLSAPPPSRTTGLRGKDKLG
jgi:hypothetical protein